VIHFVGEVDSTQRLAREAAVGGAPHGTAFVASAQLAGRGRLGRSWQSEPGQNLLLSVVLRPDVPVAEAPLLSLGAAAGLAITFDLRVKWPNDLMSADGRKVGGLLAELDVRGDRVGFVILGLGLNVNQLDFPGLTATSLRALGGGGEAIKGVAETARKAILAWCTHPARLDEWRRVSHTLGRRVRVGDREGIATAIRDDGALIVGGEAVLTGDVELVASGS
jgi:BirA family biotin operon repressor/biotin-[acetyl-CoA-carboxylase] ligase